MFNTARWFWLIIFSLWGIVIILLTISPTKIRDWGWSNSFLPFVGLISLSIFGLANLLKQPGIISFWLAAAVFLISLGWLNQWTDIKIWISAAGWWFGGWLMIKLGQYVDLRREEVEPADKTCHIRRRHQKNTHSKFSTGLSRHIKI